MMIIIIDHVNLKMFLLNKNLFEKKMKWWKKLFNLDLIIKYKSKKQNFVNITSRRSDYEIKNIKKYKNKILKFFKNNIVNSINCWIWNWSVCKMLTIHKRCVYQCFEFWFIGDAKEFQKWNWWNIKNNFTNNKTSLKNTTCEDLVKGICTSNKKIL